MDKEEQIVFPPFRLDISNRQLWRGQERLHIRPKTFAVLRHLAHHAGQLVTKEELIQSVWPDTRGTKDLPKRCISELRLLLEDTAEKPRYIETRERYGYCFIAPVSNDHVTFPDSKDSFPLGSQNHNSQSRETRKLTVGRDQELSRLGYNLRQALDGNRQLVFVTGEPGIGKTTVVDAFLSNLPDAQNFWIGRGQCVEHYGTGEAYLPVLEALVQISRENGEKRFLEMLLRHAPNWSSQMPVLVEQAERKQTQPGSGGATRERMLRELAEVLELLAAEKPILLVLEDLHWVDASTVTLLSYLGHRRQSARLLIVGTYRPVDLIVHNHPLRNAKQDLQRHEKCSEVALSGLTERAVADYLTRRLQQQSIPRELVEAVHLRTGGNPFFLTQIAEEWLAQHQLDDITTSEILHQKITKLNDHLPASVHDMLAQQIDQLEDEEQRVLETASAIGMEFTVATVAAGMEKEIETIEERCTILHRKRLFIESIGESVWPDGTSTTRYRFLHSLYQNFLYERISPGLRRLLHQRIADRQEQGYKGGVQEIALELAVHLERSHAYERAIPYFQQAGENALRQSAPQEAIRHFVKGLELLKTLPDDTKRSQRELEFQLSLGVSLLTVRGHAAPEVERAYIRARELAERLENAPCRFQALLGLLRLYAVQGKFNAAHELGEECLRLAQGKSDSTFLSWSHCFLGETSFYLSRLPEAQEHLEQGISAYNSIYDRPLSYLYGQDPKVGCLYHAALCLWLRGYPDRALVSAEEAIVLAKDIACPFSLAGALNFAAATHQFRGEAQATQQRAEQALTLAMEHGFPQWLMVGMILRGWALAAQGKDGEGIPLMVQGLNAQRESGALMSRPYFYALLVDVYQRIGKTAEGLATIAEALEVVRQTEEHVAEGELHRLKGILLLQAAGQHSTSKVQKEAEGCFLQAIDLARQQQAKSLELRAQINLSRLWRQQRKTALARTELTKIYKWFSEGVTTEDHLAATNLLAELNT